MEISKEIIEAQSFTDDQVAAINGFGKTHTDTLIADTKKEYDGKASKDAEAILHDATQSIVKSTGVSHDDGQKISDFFAAAFTKHTETKTSELDTKISAYDEKIKNFKGDEATALELTKTKTSLDDLLKKTADYDTLKETADKYSPLMESYSTLKINQSFASVKPVFNKDVNEYETKAKWDAFIVGVLDKNTIEIVDGEAIAIDKENKHKTTKLKDLVDGDETIKGLIEGRKQDGPGGKEIPKSKIEGIPFEVPKDLSPKDRAELIKTELIKQGLKVMSNEFADKFEEYNNIILKQKTV